MITYTECPVCGQQKPEPAVTVTDHSVSKESFTLVKCNHCSLMLTQNAPGSDSMAAYYQFEDYISHTNSKKGLINKLYHLVRNWTLHRKYKLIGRFTKLKTGSVLDIGSGTGRFLHQMQKKNWRIIGLEPDISARNKAKELYGLDTYDNQHLFTLPKNNFNAITLWHVLEHVHQLTGYLQTIKSLLKPGGVLFIAVPNYTSTDSKHYQENWAAYDVPRHLYHFSPKAMEVLSFKFGFTIEKMIPMWFDSFYVCMLSEKYKKGNYFKAVINGLYSNWKAIGRPENCSSVIYVMRVNNE
jgi:2-polyprenyl-3-methyl-5-hydroxy-6-metoxy-1,4-benzoquinol methylase